MNKNKKILGLVATLLSAASLTGCNNVTSKEGVVLTYNGVDYKVDDLFKHFENDKTSASTMFDAVYKVAVESYFKTSTDSDLKSRIEKEAKNDLAQAKEDAQQNANSNGTSYNEEFIKILKANDAKDEVSLLDHYIYDHQKSEFNDLLYDNNLEVLKIGDNNGVIKLGNNTTTKFDGNYINEKFPYHVRHILAKTESSSNPFSGKITSDQAKKLYKIVRLLAEGDRSFGEIAFENSDDSGSAEQYGNLGIMDKDTSYVNEFKLGLFAYDYLYNQQLKTNRNKVEQKLQVPDEAVIVLENEKDPLIPPNDINSSAKYFFNAPEIKYEGEGASKKRTYDELVSSNFLGEIPFSRFYQINEVADIEKAEDANGTTYTLVDGSSSIFPRNIYYNLYLNKKNINFITISKNDKEVLTGKMTFEEKVAGSGKTGFLKASDVKGIRADDWKEGTDDKLILTDEKDNPIIAFRSGTSGDSGYEGIHFVSIIRTGFVDELDESAKPKVKQKDYWTYYYPGETNYPSADYEVRDGEDKDAVETFVNYIKSSEVKDYKKNAETVKSKIKEYQSNFDTYVYEALVESGNLKIAENEVGKLIENNIKNFITISRGKTKLDYENSWEETWLDWTEDIVGENKYKFQKNQTIDKGNIYTYTTNEVCAIKFTKKGFGDGYNNVDDKALFEQGGLCYVKD